MGKLVETASCPFIGDRGENGMNATNEHNAARRGSFLGKKEYKNSPDMFCS